MDLYLDILWVDHRFSRINPAICANLADPIQAKERCIVTAIATYFLSIAMVLSKNDITVMFLREKTRQ